MVSKLKRAAAAAVRDWCARTGAPAKSIRHVHPRAYVIVRAAPGCLIVARPWQDSEPQQKAFERANPIQQIRTFDKSLDAGMWCATAYVVRPGIGEPVAVYFDG